MRVGLIQSNYLPWRGYFDFISDVDLFIFYDEVQYTKGDWRNRNLIKTPNGKQWLTVPVKMRSARQLIKDVSIDNTQDWISSQINRFDVSYKTAPFYPDAINFLERLKQKKMISISELNRMLITDICKYLDILTPLDVSWNYPSQGTKTERIIEILHKVHADVYLSGPSADSYLDKSLFLENNIQLEYKSYSYDPYPQQWGSFMGDVTILDLIANCGSDSHHFIKSKEKNNVVVPRI